MSVLTDVQNRFVLHWGEMARNWGISKTMGQIHALLFISGREWSAEEIMEELTISRGNVSMTLRELVNWGLVYRVHRRGERREFYQAEQDVWEIFNRIIIERKKREVDPTIAELQDCAELVRNQAHDSQAQDAEALAILQRIEAWREFFEAMDAFHNRFTPHSKADVEAMAEVIKVDVQGLS